MDSICHPQSYQAALFSSSYSFRQLYVATPCSSLTYPGLVYCKVYAGATNALRCRLTVLLSATAVQQPYIHWAIMTVGAGAANNALQAHRVAECHCCQLTSAYVATEHL
jgi:hypothetical protein